MAVNQRDVYLIEFPPFDNVIDQHLFIVLSIEESNQYENSFIAAMITSTKYQDDYSFPISDGMFDSPLDKSGSHVRMHLITLCYDREIKGRKVNAMKEFYFRQLMKSIGDLVFNYNFTPNIQ